MRPEAHAGRIAMGLRVDAARLLRATVLAAALYVAAPLAALPLRDLTDDVLAHHAGPALAAAALASVALVAQLMLGHFCHLDLVRVAEVQQMRLRGELMDLVNGPPRIDHLDRPDITDNVDLVRDSLLATTRSLEGILQLTGLLLQMTVTIVLLVMVSPLFAVLPVCAVVPVILERTAQSTVEGAREKTAERLRLGGITVLISHRFSTVGMADLIAVLDHGQLTECGTHRELMTARGLYAVGSSACPTGVSRTPSRPRSNSGAPSCRSSILICLLNAGWEMYSRSARAGEMQIFGDRHEVAQIPPVHIHNHQLSHQALAGPPAGRAELTATGAHPERTSQGRT